MQVPLRSRHHISERFAVTKKLAPTLNALTNQHGKAVFNSGQPSQDVPSTRYSRLRARLPPPKTMSCNHLPTKIVIFESVGLVALLCLIRAKEKTLME